MSQLAIGARAVIDVPQLSALLTALRDDGYDVLGPTVRDGAISLGPIRTLDDLPRGVGDEQAPGRYRLTARGDGALFSFAAPAQALKRELLTPRATLVTTRRSGGELTVEPPATPTRKVAFFGARPCEVAAIAVQDRVLRGGPAVDVDYAARRDGAFIFAVNCNRPAGTCFCASMGAGPTAKAGFDLAATELLDTVRPERGPGHGSADGSTPRTMNGAFLLEVGSVAGAQLLERLKPRAPAPEELAAAEALGAAATTKMGRALDPNGLHDALLLSLDHPRWAEVGERCLGCANCTMACPTCFCTTTEDTTDLSGVTATRTRRWDSCFSLDFGYVHGGTVRPSLRARYRQWLTHKLAGWIDQFGTSGCVGCGRCITWCPVGIDLTQEVAALRSQPVHGSRHG